MPYAILVSALGAIISTAIAMFAMHSWSATKIAPFVGAILGLIVGIAALRLRGLPLRATLEEYRAAGGGESVGRILSLYLKIALNTSIVVSVVELPIFLIDRAAGSYVFVAGLMVIIAYTVYRVWSSNDPRLFNIDLDVFNIAGAAGMFIMSGGHLYAAFRGWHDLMPNTTVPDSDLIKGVFVCNAFGAFTAPVIAVFGLNLSHRLAKLMSTQQR